MTVNVILAHTEPNHSNFLSCLLFQTDVGWLLVFVGIVIVVSLVVVAINTFSATASDDLDDNRTIFQEQRYSEVMSDEQFNQEG